MYSFKLIRSEMNKKKCYLKKDCINGRVYAPEKNGLRIFKCPNSKCKNQKGGLKDGVSEKNHSS
jgi:hypothetical protein